MKEIMRIPRILGKIRRVWYATPDLRLAQLVCILAPLGQGSDPFHVEDDVIEAELDRIIDSLGVKDLADDEVPN